MNRTHKLIERWRGLSPADWAESEYGWILPSGRPIVLADWQRAVLDAWYANPDVSILVVSAPKKVGKTLLNGLLLCWRWLCLPGEHFAVANDLDQAVGRQFSEVSEMVRRHPFLRSKVQADKKRLEFRPTYSTITALPVDAAGNSGANHLSASHTEAWAICAEGAIRAYEELVPPPHKHHGFPALRIVDSYAGFDGESALWHGIIDRALGGDLISAEWPIYRARGTLLFHIDGVAGQERCFRGDAEERQAYLDDQREQLRPAAYQRLHENKRSTGSESFISMAAWDACIDADLKPMMPNRDSQLVIGVDAALKNDCAAVVAVSYVDGRVVLARHRIWTPTKTQPLDLDSTIGSFLRELRDGYDIASVLYDPWQMADLSNRLHQEGLPMREYPQTSPNLTATSQNLFELIQHQNIQLYPDDQLRSHAAHCVAVESSRGWKISKAKAANKVDGIVTLAMASLEAVRGGSEMPLVLMAV